MSRRAKLVLTSLTAAVVLAALVGTATAQRIEISNTGIRATFPNLRFAERVPAGGPEVVCPVTIEGTFHSRTIVKTPELLVGYITRAILNRNRCIFFNGPEDVRINEESLPWHIKYEAFRGRLPIIEDLLLRLQRVEFTLREFGVDCRYRSTLASPARGSVNRNTTTGQVSGLTAFNETSIPKAPESSFLCPASGIFEGRAEVRLLGSGTTLIFVRLV